MSPSWSRLSKTEAKPTKVPPWSSALLISSGTDLCCGALTWPARAATDSTIGKQPTPTRDRAPVSGTDRPAQCPQTRVSLIFDAVVCGSGTPGLHTVVSTATLHGPSSRCRPMG